MDFDNTPEPGNTEYPQSTPPQQPKPAQMPPVTPNIPDFSSAVYNPYPQKKKGSGWKVFWGIVITLSLMANGLMFIGIITMAAFAGGSSYSSDGLVEKVVRTGERHKKIAVIDLQGVIDGKTSDWVHRQIRMAQNDNNVKGLILLINSPGGGVSASDQIHHYVSEFKKDEGKPVLCFMQGLAASGGYYSAVACDEIMAEPTTITGSIGVIMNIMVVRELLEEKLGVNPVTIKSGARKDWPSMYNDMTDEQEAYLKERIIMPSYERFVDLIAEGRKDVLTRSDILKLADGSIYTAQQAVDNKLIDDIGYFEDAIYRAEQMAGIAHAKIVCYEMPVTLRSMMGFQAQSPINIDADLLDKVAAPRLLYLWDGRK